MGGEQSTRTQNNKKDEENHQRTMRYALEKQRMMYEAKCKELLEAQKKEIKKACVDINLQARSTQNSTVVTQSPTAPLYPNLQQIDKNAVIVRPSSSSVSYDAREAYGQMQNKPQCSTTNPFSPHGIAMGMGVSHTPLHLVQGSPISNASTSRTSPNSITAFMHTSQPSAPFEPSAPAEPSATSQLPQASRRIPYPRQKKNKNEKHKTCPTCKKRLEDVIFQCQQGHSCCKDCKTKSLKCGVCRSTITNTRNFEMENLMEKLELQDSGKKYKRVPCSNKSDGCRLTYKEDADMKSHLKECLFREMECPVSFLSGCSWCGKINQMQSHFCDSHLEHEANVNEELNFKIDSETHSVKHISIGGFNFFVHIYINNKLQAVYMTVQLVGPRASAPKWTYEFQVYNKNEPKRKFVYIDQCSSNIVPFKNVFDEEKCAVLPMPYAKSYSNENKVTFKVYITKPN